MMDYHVKYFFVFILILFLCVNCGSSGEKNENETDLKNDSVVESNALSPENENDNSERSKVTFIELGSVNCIPCKMMQPIMAEIEKEYKDQVNVVFHDVWTKEGQPYAEKYKIKLIPTQVFLDKDGVEYFRHEGFFPKDELVKILKMRSVN
ncbi:thioredoxin family protein [Candidatus Latescibacterota bacterium]